MKEFWKVKLEWKWRQEAFALAQPIALVVGYLGRRRRRAESRWWRLGWDAGAARGR